MYAMAVSLGWCAQTAGLRAVPPQLVPPLATFYSVQKLDDQPPLPCNPFPGLPVFELPDGLGYLIDDCEMDYSSLEPPDGGGTNEFASQSLDTPYLPPGVGTGCGLWLDVTASNDVALLTLHNTRPGQTYTVWSIEDLGTNNWMVETNLTGDSGNLT
jgi:hypothetical protein